MERSRRRDDGDRLHGRAHRSSDVPSGLFSYDRPRRGRACPLRYVTDERGRPDSVVLRDSRPHAGGRPGQRHRRPVSFRNLDDDAAPATGRDRFARRLPGGVERARIRPDPDGDLSGPLPRVERPILAGRGLPPAVSVQEPRRLRVPRAHGRGMPGASPGVDGAQHTHAGADTIVSAPACKKISSRRGCR